MTPVHVSVPQPVLRTNTGTRSSQDSGSEPKGGTLHPNNLPRPPGCVSDLGRPTVHEPLPVYNRTNERGGAAVRRRQPRRPTPTSRPVLVPGLPLRVRRVRDASARVLRRPPTGRLEPTPVAPDPRRIADAEVGPPSRPVLVRRPLLRLLPLRVYVGGYGSTGLYPLWGARSVGMWNILRSVGR